MSARRVTARPLSLLVLALTACTVPDAKPPVTEVDVAIVAESPPAPQTLVVDSAPPSERPFEVPREEPPHGLFEADEGGVFDTGPVQGVMGGVAAAPPAPVAPPSGTPPLLQTASLSCLFPKDAPADVDGERTIAVVDVDAAGVATAVVLVRDPGRGFGRETRECLKRARYTPATDAKGRAVAGKTAPLLVRFQR